MSKVIVSKDKLENIADSIREKSGSEGKYTLDEMPNAIDNLGGVKTWITLGSSPMYNVYVSEALSRTSYGNRYYYTSNGGDCYEHTFTWDVNEMMALYNKYKEYDVWYNLWDGNREIRQGGARFFMLKTFPFYQVFDGNTKLDEDQGGVAYIAYDLVTHKFLFSSKHVSQWSSLNYDTYMSAFTSIQEMSGNSLRVIAYGNTNLSDTWGVSMQGYRNNPEGSDFCKLLCDYVEITPEFQPFVGMIAAKLLPVEKINNKIVNCNNTTLVTMSEENDYNYQVCVETIGSSVVISLTGNVITGTAKTGTGPRAVYSSNSRKVIRDYTNMWQEVFWYYGRKSTSLEQSGVFQNLCKMQTYRLDDDKFTFTDFNTTN